MSNPNPIRANLTHQGKGRPKGALSKKTLLKQAYTIKFITDNLNKPIEQVISEQVLPSVAKIIEVRDTAERPETALQASKYILDKALPDRVEVHRTHDIRRIDTADLVKLVELAKDSRVIDVDNSNDNKGIEDDA